MKKIEIKKEKKENSKLKSNNNKNNNKKKMSMIKELVKNILTHYKEKEEKEGGEKIFFTHDEYSSHVTEFEGLSNEKRIVLQSSLNKIDVLIIMRLFQNVYDDNYYRFEDTNEFMVEFEETTDMTISEADHEKLASYSDSKIWIKYLTMLYEEDEAEEEEEEEGDNEGDDEEYDEDKDKDELKEFKAYNLSATKRKPAVENYGFEPKKKQTKKQKIYKIEDIIDLIL